MGVDNCNGEEFIFSRELMTRKGGQIMARQLASPHKTFILDWQYSGSACTGEKFFKIVTGDYKGDTACTPKAYDFSTNAWGPSGDGWCNTNSHTQFNCVAESYASNGWASGAKGLRFHWGTRETANDGGSQVTGAWAWWTGWTSSYGSNSDIVDNFDSWDGTSGGTVEGFYRSGGSSIVSGTVTYQATQLSSATTVVPFLVLRSPSNLDGSGKAGDHDIYIHPN